MNPHNQVDWHFGLLEAEAAAFLFHTWIRNRSKLVNLCGFKKMETTREDFRKFKSKECFPKIVAN